jgi:hypothetical protein
MDTRDSHTFFARSDALWMHDVCDSLSLPDACTNPPLTTVMNPKYQRYTERIIYKLIPILFQDIVVGKGKDVT